jgi:hypothetical protein
MSLILLLLGLLIIVSITYLLFRYVYKPWSSGMTTLEKGPIPLNEQKIYKFLPANNKLDNYTFTFYIKPGPANKTKVLGTEFEGLAPIFYWSPVFYLIKKAGENKNILYVNTATGYIPIYCPPLPEHKWTFVAIVIDGRRFSIVYNGRVVSSKLIDKMPIITKAGQLGSGYSNIFGDLAHVSYNNRAMTAEELAIEYASSSDTRGKPYTETMSLMNLFGCPAEGCMKPAIPPIRASMSWLTPYA